MQALVEHKGKQFLVEENSEFKFPYLGGKIGEKIELEKILYTDDSKKKKFGSPYIDGLAISAEILSHGRDKKVVVVQGLGFVGSAIVKKLVKLGHKVTSIDIIEDKEISKIS